jgi:hypothetical protein
MGAILVTEPINYKKAETLLSLANNNTHSCKEQSLKSTASDLQSPYLVA